MNRYLQISLLFLVLFALQFVYFDFKEYQNNDNLIDEHTSLRLEVTSLKEEISSLHERLDVSTRKSFVNSHQIPIPVEFCADTLDYSNHTIRERIEREFYSLLSKQGQIQLYLKRTAKYEKMIEKYLSESGLPNDLKYLAIHESALLPQIRSKSNAVGLWQLMRSTARLYGLKINRYVDERRDPEKATRAALRFISDLHREYKSWPLVLAAYNGGQNRIKREVKKQKSDSFFDLSLPEETERYYFKIVATKVLLSQPETFGFHLQEEDLFKPISYEIVELEVDNRELAIEELSDKYNLSLAEFKYLNPHLINTYLPRGSYRIYIPQVNVTGNYSKNGESGENSASRAYGGRNPKTSGSH